MKRSLLTSVVAAIVAALSFGVIALPQAAAAFLTPTVTLTPSTTTVTYGTETTVTFDVTVSKGLLVDPIGTVNVVSTSSSTPLCTITLVGGDDGSGACSISSDTVLSASGSPYSIIAKFGGDSVYGPADSSPSGLTVDQATTTTSLAVSASTVTFGDESTLQLTPTVTPQSSGTPTGDVTVSAGATTLCTVTLPTQTSCSPLDDVLAASGTQYQLTADYAGDSNFTGSSTTTSQPLTVTPGNTTTTLAITPSSTVIYGDESAATFTPTISSTQSGTPTGTVTISTGETTLCSFDVSVATSCTTTDTELGASGTPYDVIASYSGDSNFTPSSSDPQDFTVDQASTTTSLTLPSSSVVYGNEGSVTFSPTVMPQLGGTPSGTVTIATGSTTICTFTLPSGTGCSAPATLLPASGSPYPVTAAYGGDSNFTSSTSTPAQNLTVTQDPTGTALAVSATSVAYGNEASLIFTATVTPQFAGSPTGTVNVLAGSTTLCSITLPATTCSTTNQALNASGTAYAITAKYLGDTNFATSTSSPAKALTVNQDPTSTTLMLSPVTVAVGSESSVVFTATVNPQFAGTPSSGTITVATTVAFTPTTLCTIALPATTCSTADDPLAPSNTPYAVTASFGGGGNFAASTPSPAKQLTVTAAGTTTSLTPSVSSVTYGDEQSVTFNAAVTPTVTGGAAPTGVVTVSTTVGSTPTTLCTFDVGSATSCTTSTAALGASSTPYPVIATYGGDSNYAGSSSTPASNLTVTQASTGTALISVSPSTTVTYGQSSVGFTVTVSPEFSGSPTGTVTVSSGATTLCSFTLSGSDNGSGSCSESPATALAASASPYPVTASYAGDTNFSGSLTPSPTDLTVDQATSSTALSLSTSSVPFGEEKSVQYNVTVSPQVAGTPTGSVTVTTGSTTLCTIASLTNGSGSCKTSSNTLLVASATPYPVVATYAGDTNFSTSTSSPAQDLTVTAGSVPSSTSLSPSVSSVTFGSESGTGGVQYTVTVSSQESGTPTGTVTVATPSTTLCTVTLIVADAGQGQCSPTSATLLNASSTPYVVTASYSGDTIFSTSLSSSTHLTVNQDPTSTQLSVSGQPVTYGAEQQATFSAAPVPPFPTTPTGSITITAGGKTLCSFSVSSASQCTTGATTLGAGSYTVVASYTGDTNYQSSTSSAQGLTVEKAASSTPSIANLPSSAAEQGTFTANVATNGDGARSVSSQSPTNCTVGSDGLTVTFEVEGTCTLTPSISGSANFNGATGSPQTFTISPGPRGYWLVGSDGGIFSFGKAQFYGSMGGTTLQRPVVGITPTHSKNGYWLVASDGGLFAFGDANFYGSIPQIGLHPAGSGQPNSLAAPIVAMVPSFDGGGYFMVASDGGVFAFGDARFAGSCPGIGGCVGTAVAVMPDASGNGYWLVTSGGAIYAFGDAPFFGSPSAQGAPVTSAVATPDGQGYWILYANGAVANFGDAAAYGNPVGYVNGFNPATSIFPTSDGQGYWVASAKGDVFSYGNAPFLGSMSSTPLNGSIIAAFGF